MNKKKLFKAERGYPRLDHFLTESLPGLSRSKIEKLIKEKRVKLNDKLIIKKNKEIVVDDRVEIEFVEPVKKEYQPSRELSKLFEDEHLLIIDKPPGFSVHPGAGESGETILDIFAYYYPQIKEISESDRPGIVHRLDKETSGVLLLAKDWKTMKALQKQFKRREVKKTYLALVSGKMRFRNGTIDVPIMRSRRDRRKFTTARREEDIELAREAVTGFSVLKEFGNFSYVKLFPHTGRTHQLRVHLSYFGNPVLGDRLYGRRESFVRMALHAYAIEFYHPVSGNLIMCDSPPPLIFRDFLKKNFKP
ncbi:MAG: RluA family pseudouridine synthase [Candidatus Aminicenantes bacterium]|nr:RluA family pseudouridine synthase [Candidatus Aminicenantes bacterium]